MVDVNDEMISLWDDLSNFNSHEFKITLEALKKLRFNKENYTTEQYLTELQKLHDDLLNNIER